MHFFQGVNWWYLISKEVWVLSVCVGGFNLPGNSGTVAGCARGSEELLAASWVHSGLIYRDPWLLPLLLPASLAFCSLLDFLPEGWVRAVERSPPICLCDWSLDSVVGGREVDIMS